MPSRCLHLSLLLGPVVVQAAADTRYKVITPAQNKGLCLDQSFNDPQNGNQLGLWECNGNDSQKWVFAGNQIRYGANENFCVDGLELNDGAELMLWECNFQDSQRWGFYESRGQIYADSNDGSKCWDFNENQQPAVAYLWTCNGLDKQKWSLGDTPDLAPIPAPAPAPTPIPGTRYKVITPAQNNGLCLDDPHNDPQNGNQLWLWACNGYDSQKWVFGDNQIRYGANENFCVDGVELNDPTQLMLWECNFQDSQTWVFDESSGQISATSNDGSKCWDYNENQQPAVAYQQPAVAYFWTCNGLGKQMWSLVDAPDLAPILAPASAPTPISV